MLLRWIPALAAAALLCGCADSNSSDGAAGAAGSSAAGSGAGGAGASGGTTGGKAAGGAQAGGAAGSTAAGASFGGAAGNNAGGAAGAGGSAGASGSAGSSSSGGTGGSGGCTPVTLGDLITVDTEAGGSSLAYSVEGLNATQDHVLYIEFFDVAGTPQAGSYDLSQAPDDNYSSCARCLLGFEDLGGSSTPYYPASGTLLVTSADTNFSGVSSGKFQNVVLVESTLTSSVTDPISGGKCWALGGGWER